MDSFAGSIKKKYRERLINSEKQWPICNSSKLVRLNLVERNKGYQLLGQRNKGTPLLYGDIFTKQNTKKPVRKVLVEGGAGTGKTTLCTSASEEWADGKLFQQFELLLLLPLRQKSVASAGSVSDLLKLLHSSPIIRDTVAHYLEDEEGEKVLIIADGWDELSASNRQEDSFLYRLFFQMFPLMSVLLTSRPSSANDLHGLPNIDRFTELQGFNKENIIEYIHSEFSNDDQKAGRLLMQLENNPLVESVCSIPLNCTIMVHLWRTLEEALPTTLTELYTKIILNVVLRNIRKLPSYASVMSLSNFDSLPEGLQQAWWLLCEFAFRAIEKDQTVFSNEELAKFIPEGLSSSILGFGLVQSAEFIFETGSVQSFQFMHVTFQEYLSALHLLRQSSENLLRIIDAMTVDTYLSPYSLNSYPVSATFSTKLKRFSIIWQTFFGVYFSQSTLRSNLDIEVVTQLLASISESPFHVQLICNCAFEARNELIDKEVIRSFSDLEYSVLTGQVFTYSDVPTFNFGHPHTPYECSAVINIISVIKECGCAIINFSDSSVSDNQIRSLTDALASKHGKLQVVALNLSGNNLTDKSVCDLFHRASASFRIPAALDLSSNMIGVESINSISAALKISQSLTADNHQHDSGLLALGRLIQMNSSSLTLNLSHNPLGTSGLLALESAIRCDSLHNLVRLYLKGTLTSDANINAACLNSFLDACFPVLSYLDISHNNLGVPGALALSSFFKRLDPLSSQPQYSYKMIRRQMELGETRLGDEGLIALLQCIEGPCDAIELGLSSNLIHGIGISFLADVICSRKIAQLFGLNLDNNPLCLEGTIALGRMVSDCNHQLSYLMLSGCQLTIAGEDAMVTNTSTGIPRPDNTFSEVVKISYAEVEQQLCQMSLNDTITSLHLNDNSFTGGRILVLAGFMRLCQRLRNLATSKCGITANDLRQLLDRLTELKSSPSSLCSELKEWDLTNNDIDDDGLSTLVDHIPLLFPNLDYNQRLYLECNPVSHNLMKTLRIRLSQDSLAMPQVTNTKGMTV